MFQLGVRANVYDISSSASAVSVVESTPEVGRTSDDDNQPSASWVLRKPIQALSRMISKYQNLRLSGSNQLSWLQWTPFKLSH